MDFGVVIALSGLAFTSGSGLVAVTVYAVNSRGIANQAQHKARNVEAAQQGLADKTDRIYVRKETLEPQIALITDSLKRIEDRQTDLITRLMGGV